jgi:hypothetical protein
MLPNGVRLAEPSKLKERDVRALLKHWFERQEDDSHPHAIQFSSFLSKDMDIIPCEARSPVQKQRKKRHQFRKQSRSSQHRKGKHKAASSESEGEVFDMDISSDSDDDEDEQRKPKPKSKGKTTGVGGNAKGSTVAQLQHHTTRDNAVHAKGAPFRGRSVSPAPLPPAGKKIKSRVPSANVPVHRRSVSPIPLGAKMGPPKGKPKTVSADKQQGRYSGQGEDSKQPTRASPELIARPVRPKPMKTRSKVTTDVRVKNENPLKASDITVLANSDTHTAAVHSKVASKRKRPIPIFNKSRDPLEEYDGTRKTRSMAAMEKLNEQAEREAKRLKSSAGKPRNR